MKNKINSEKAFNSFIESDTKGATNGILAFDDIVSPETWFSTPQTAAYLDISVHALLNMTSNGKIPYYKLGRRNRYKKSDLDQLLEISRKGPCYGH